MTVVVEQSPAEPPDPLTASGIQTLDRSTLLDKAAATSEDDFRRAVIGYLLDQRGA